jgi:hypothetical protein
MNIGRTMGSENATIASSTMIKTADKVFGADHEAGVIGSQKGDRLGDLIRVRDAANRHLGRHGSGWTR